LEELDPLMLSRRSLALAFELASDNQIRPRILGELESFLCRRHGPFKPLPQFAFLAFHLRSSSFNRLSGFIDEPLRGF
jgi:hypothetical protein